MSDRGGGGGGMNRRRLPVLGAAGFRREAAAGARSTFFVLLGLSAVFGAMCGLMLVYSIDLPQMEDLARYRPNTTTELLDVHGKVFGSFALERRVVVPYAEFPPVLRRRSSRSRTRALRATGG